MQSSLGESEKYRNDDIENYHIKGMLQDLWILFVLYSILLCLLPGGRLNKKDGLTSYGNSHVKDKTS